MRMIFCTLPSQTKNHLFWANISIKIALIGALKGNLRDWGYTFNNINMVMTKFLSLFIFAHLIMFINLLITLLYFQNNTFLHKMASSRYLFWCAVDEHVAFRKLKILDNRKKRCLKGSFKNREYIDCEWSSFIFSIFSIQWTQKHNCTADISMKIIIHYFFFI